MLSFDRSLSELVIDVLSQEVLIFLSEFSSFSFNFCKSSKHGLAEKASFFVSPLGLEFLYSISILSSVATILKGTARPKAARNSLHCACGDIGIIVLVTIPSLFWFLKTTDLTPCISLKSVFIGVDTNLGTTFCSTISLLMSEGSHS